MTTTSIVNRICAAFTAVDSHPDSPLLAALKTRLLGELFGDADAVASTLAPQFELVMHGGPEFVTMSKDAVLGAVRQQAVTGALMWTEFELLRESEAALSGHGVLCTVAEQSLVTVPIAVFLNYEGSLMVSEVVFTGAASAPQPLDSKAVVTPEVLHEALAVS